jgi:hypothetical protein
MQLEENLLCIADSLGEVADAVSTTVWPSVEPGDNNKFVYADDGGASILDPEAGVGISFDNVLYGEWDIPPQADSDRFIIRDLAIHTLAMMATLDSYTDIAFPSPMPAGTCAQAYAWMSNPTNAPSYLSPNSSCIQAKFAAPVFAVSSPTPNSSLPLYPDGLSSLCDGGNNVPFDAQASLSFETSVLRAGGRLLHDLVRRDVYSDMAAASQQAAQTLDPQQGALAQWGQGPNGPYGSIAHAARVLLGRWELGDAVEFGAASDPQCESIAELNLLPDAFGNDLSARYEDLSIRTPGEQTAATLVEQAGLVVPSCILAASASASDAGGAGPGPLGAALLEQLLAQTQAQNHLPAPPPATVLSNVLTGVSEADLAFAFQRTLDTWRLLTNSADTTAPGTETDGGSPPCVPVTSASTVAGLTVTQAPAGSALAAVHGITITSVPAAGQLTAGLSRSRLHTDPMARAGGMMEASQCDLATIGGYWDEWGTDGTAIFWNASSEPTAPYFTTPPASELPGAVFQDSFHIGQALERRLNVVQQAIASQVGQSATNDALSTALGGIAELRTWAGSVIVRATPVGVPPYKNMNVLIAGLSYGQDFPSAPANTTTVQNAFAFVYGAPWVAECAAGLRQDCPTDFVAQYVQMPSSATDVTAQYATSGTLNSTFQLVVPLGGVLTPPTNGSTQESHLYMVRLQDPGNSLGQGRVLGTLRLLGGRISRDRYHEGVTGFVDAPMQRELVHDAIDLGAWVGAKPPAVGADSASSASGYCVDGVPKDLFVPLDNELVSGSAAYEDSWQNYLSLAQQAAQTADTLGQQLIADDLQIAENEQAAAQQLANICGDFGALSSATVGNDGTITAGPEDPTTQQCLTPYPFTGSSRDRVVA